MTTALGTWRTHPMVQKLQLSEEALNAFSRLQESAPKTYTDEKIFQMIVTDHFNGGPFETTAEESASLLKNAQFSRRRTGMRLSMAEINSALGRGGETKAPPAPPTRTAASRRMSMRLPSSVLQTAAPATGNLAFEEIMGKLSKRDHDTITQLMTQAPEEYTEAEVVRLLEPSDPSEGYDRDVVQMLRETLVGGHGASNALHPAEEKKAEDCHSYPQLSPANAELSDEDFTILEKAKQQGYLDENALNLVEQINEFHAILATGTGRDVEENLEQLQMYPLAVEDAHRLIYFLKVQYPDLLKEGPSEQKVADEMKLRNETRVSGQEVIHSAPTLAELYRENPRDIPQNLQMTIICLAKAKKLVTSDQERFQKALTSQMNLRSPAVLVETLEKLPGHVETLLEAHPALLTQAMEVDGWRNTPSKIPQGTQMTLLEVAGAWNKLTPEQSKFLKEIQRLKRGGLLEKMMPLLSGPLEKHIGAILNSYPHFLAETIEVEAR